MDKWHQQQRRVKEGDKLKKQDASSYLHGYREKNIATHAKASLPNGKPQESAPTTARTPASEPSPTAVPKQKTESAQNQNTSSGLTKVRFFLVQYP